MCYRQAFGRYIADSGDGSNGRPSYSMKVGSRVYRIYNAKGQDGQATWYLDNDLDSHAEFGFIVSSATQPPSGQWSIWCGGGRRYVKFALSVSLGGAH